MVVHVFSCLKLARDASTSSHRVCASPHHDARGLQFTTCSYVASSDTSFITLQFITVGVQRNGDNCM
jgi:hypothetical protein